MRGRCGNGATSDAWVASWGHSGRGPACAIIEQHAGTPDRTNVYANHCRWAAGLD